MNHAWSRHQTREVQRLLNAPHALIALDYDGTLAPIQADPHTVTIARSQQKILQRIADHPHFTLACISGRRLVDLQQRIGVQNAYYVGNHGLEVRSPTRWLARQPSAMSVDMRRVERLLVAEWKHERGVYIENKGPVVVAHFRNVPSARRAACERALRRSMRAASAGVAARMVGGKAVIELRPDTPEHKGWAAQQVLAKLPQGTLALTCGDDRTDEDMFRSLKKPHVSILVGRKLPTAATYRTTGPQAVWRLLSHLASAKKSC